MTKQTTKTTDGTEERQERLSEFPLVRINFILMAVAAVMIVVGFALTSGGGSADATQFNPEIFSVRRIVIGPNIAFLGFLFMAFAIIWPGKKKKKENQ